MSESRKRGVKFGNKIIPKYLKLESLFELIYNDITLDYTLLMPTLLFLPSFTKPIDIINILINNYKKISLINSRENCKYNYSLTLSLVLIHLFFLSLFLFLSLNLSHSLIISLTFSIIYLFIDLLVF